MSVQLSQSPSVSLTAIEGTDCLGDTYTFLNKNFENISRRLGRIQARTTTTPSTLTRALSVYDENNVYLGYIPIYT
jgi:hypothetical protein